MFQQVQAFIWAFPVYFPPSKKLVKKKEKKSKTQQNPVGDFLDEIYPTTPLLAKLKLARQSRKHK
jgi:hypothetical protein